MVTGIGKRLSIRRMDLEWRKARYRRLADFPAYIFNCTIVPSTISNNA